MIIAGAGGHSLEVYDILLRLGYDSNSIYFFEEKMTKSSYEYMRKISVEKDIVNHLAKDPEFCLGVGKGLLREKLYHNLTNMGGIHVPIVCPTAIVSDKSVNLGADIMSNCIVNSQSEIGLGALINARVNIHHEAKVGKFSEISPSSTLLGNVEVGSYCQIGSNTTILPNKKVGDHVISGAGSVVTTDIRSNVKIKGIPAKEF